MRLCTILKLNRQLSIFHQGNVKHKGPAGGNTVLDIELDDGAFNLISFFVASQEMNDLSGKIHGEQIEIFGQVTFTHHRPDWAVEIRHKAVDRIPPAIQMGCDINGCPNLIALAGFFEKVAQIKVLNQEIGDYL